MVGSSQSYFLTLQIAGTPLGREEEAGMVLACQGTLLPGSLFEFDQLYSYKLKLKSSSSNLVLNLTF